MNHLFEALDHPRRRYLLYTFGAEGKRSLWAIARRIAAWEGDVPEETVREDEVERVYVSLYHNHVPKLTNRDIITFSEANETIEPASNADQVLAILNTIGGFEDMQQEAHARDEHGEGYT